MSQKPNPIELESLRSELIEKTLRTSSNNLRLSLYQNYFGAILSQDSPNFEEAFLKEFLDDYISCICKFEAWGVDPDITKKLLEQFKKVSTLKIASENHIPLNSEIDRIEKQLEKLNLILDGKDFEDGETHKAFFPLIDKQAPNGFYGIIESVTVRINKAADVDKFIIVPSEKEIEKKILEQCKKSWELALNLSKKYVKKPFKYHEVIINFDKKQGFYEGNSLGIALTLSFLEQILKFYNPSYIINIKEQSAFTGGVTETGEILCTSEEIIKRKVAAVFFSEINSFVFPKCEETYAYFALTQLKKSYPNRKLKLIPTEDITDVLNRRDVVDIKKQKLVVRSGKFVKKNWISAVATVLLAILFAYLFVMDFDDNPALLSIDGSTLFVKNRNGKILWTKKVILSQTASPNDLKIIDINSDGINEVLVTLENSDTLLYAVDYSSLGCYDNKGKLIWKYLFNDTVLSKIEELDTEYRVHILDTLTIYSKKSLYLFSQNIKSFSSAIFRIDLQTGKRLHGTFWCSGHIINGLIKDINNDGKNDLLCIGFDNGYEDAVLFGFEIDTLIKVRSTTENYLIQNFPISKMLAYLRFPKTDYEIMLNQRFTVIEGRSLNETKENDIEFVTSINKYPETRTNLRNAVFYKVNKNLKNVDVFISNDFRLYRDSLVVRGKLKPPYTDTRAYKEIIKSKILYLKAGKWVNREELY